MAGLVISAALGSKRALRYASIMADELSRLLGERLEATVAESYEQVRDMLEQGQARAGWCPALVIAGLRAPGAVVFTARRQGSTSYRAALVCSQARTLSLQALSGTRAAWVDRHSLGGYLLAREHLRHQRLEPERIFARQRFYGSYPAARDAVLRSEADLTSMSVPSDQEADLQQALAAFAGHRARQLRIIDVTASIPADGLVVMDKPGLNPDRIAAEITAANAFHPLAAAMRCEGFERTTLADYRSPLLLSCAKEMGE